MDMLILNHISKRFGEKQVLNDVCFSVKKNTVFGFAGENGAGKTTAMKLILGLLRPDGGEILVNGERVSYGANKTNRFIGYLPDVPGFYGYMTAAEYLFFCGEISGMKKSVALARTEELLRMVGLENGKKRIQGFSRGMKQRLGIAQALINRPLLLICDEPTSALDPVGRKEIIDILARAKEHTTVLFSTHILSDAERICDDVAFLHGGQITLRGSVAELRSLRRTGSFIIEFQSFVHAETVLCAFPEGRRSGASGLIFTDPRQPCMKDVMRFMAENGIEPLKLEKLEPDLESLFMEAAGR